MQIRLSSNKQLSDGSKEKNLFCQETLKKCHSDNAIGTGYLYINLTSVYWDYILLVDPLDDFSLLCMFLFNSWSFLNLMWSALHSHNPTHCDVSSSLISTYIYWKAKDHLNKKSHGYFYLYTLQHMVLLIILYFILSFYHYLLDFWKLVGLNKWESTALPKTTLFPVQSK